VTRSLADGNLWLHFTRTSDWLGPHPVVPVLARGEGCFLWDVDGKRYLDGLSALFCVQVGYGRQELVDAAAEQMARLPFATNWGYAHPPAIELAGLLAERFPGDLAHLFFVNSGSEAVETAVKLAQQHHRLNGEPDRVKVVSRHYAYHGTTYGALGVTGLAGLREPFEPLRPVHLYGPNTNAYRPEHDDPAAGIEEVILEAGPETVSAVVVEPVQNAGGCFTPPEGYLPRLREICDRHGVLLVCDEVITGFGRLGHWTGSERFGVVPDMVTFAKGVTSGYAPLGGVAFGDRVAASLQQEPTTMFLHGATWGGHPVAAAVACANLRVLEDEAVFDNVRSNEPWLRRELAGLMDAHEIVGDVRGMGHFWAMELVKDREHKVMFDDEETERLIRGFLSSRLLELGLICRADDRDEPVIQLSPPLVADRAVLGEMLGIVDQVLGEATKRMRP
jgi:adenosylmethionine-8-amino-7-oxononanoate aminotransferase